MCFSMVLPILVWAKTKKGGQEHMTASIAELSLDCTAHTLGFNYFCVLGTFWMVILRRTTLNHHWGDFSQEYNVDVFYQLFPH